jgi:hypothetical protein
VHRRRPALLDNRVVDLDEGRGPGNHNGDEKEGSGWVQTLRWLGTAASTPELLRMELT